MEDQSILDLYFQRSEQAIVETDRKYGGYCYSVLFLSPYGQWISLSLRLQWKWTGMDL